jgi:formate hydrogenlyase subunit 3/multisubunit Na+/H+ antiporter MnhD subunit
MHLKENAIAHSFGHAVLVVVYVFIVAWIMQHAQAWFGPAKTVFVPTAVLMLFVLSAAVVGSLVVLYRTDF